jgi:hypothetical protein
VVVVTAAAEEKPSILANNTVDGPHPSHVIKKILRSGFGKLNDPTPIPQRH